MNDYLGMCCSLVELISGSCLLQIVARAEKVGGGDLWWWFMGASGAMVMSMFCS